MKDTIDRKEVINALTRIASTNDGKFVLKYLNKVYLSASSKREDIYETYYALGQADLIKTINKLVKSGEEF